MFNSPLKKNMREINSTITIHEKDIIDGGKDLGVTVLKQRSKDKFTRVFVQLLETSKSSQNSHAWSK